MKQLATAVAAGSNLDLDDELPKTMPEKAAKKEVESAKEAGEAPAEPSPPEAPKIKRGLFGRPLPAHKQPNFKSSEVELGNLGSKI